MFRVQKIDSFDLPELQPYRTMRRQREHRQAGIFVAEGEKVVRRLLASRFGVVSVLLPQKWLKELEPLLQARAEQVQVFVAPKDLLERLTGFSMYQGLLAVGQVPPPRPLEEILASAARPYLLIATDGLSSAENLGAVVRNSAAFAVQALLTGDTCTSPFLRRAVRSSMGTLFELPVVEGVDLPKLLPQIKGLGFRVIAAHAHTRSRTLAQADFTRDTCLVLGSEGYGISPTALAACDELVAIPMAPGVDSLNVGCAAAVFLYEANRQRGRM